jgi:hypothetical protein
MPLGDVGQSGAPAAAAVTEGINTRPEAGTGPLRSTPALSGCNRSADAPGQPVTCLQLDGCAAETPKGKASCQLQVEEYPMSSCKVATWMLELINNLLQQLLLHQHNMECSDSCKLSVKLVMLSFPMLVAGKA